VYSNLYPLDSTVVERTWMFGPTFRPGNWEIPQNFSVTGDLLDVKNTLCTVLENVNATGKVCNIVAVSVDSCRYCIFFQIGVDMRLRSGTRCKWGQLV
jgi:hypothetical protein